MAGRPDRHGVSPSLSRPSDRIEAIVGWALTAVTMILLVLAALAGTATYAAEAGHDQSVAAARTSSTEVRLNDGSRGSDQSSRVPLNEEPPAPGMAPSVTPRTGLVLAGSGPPAGLGVGIWLDQDGRSVSPPVGSGRAALAGATSAGQVLLVGGAVLLLLRGAARRAINARNLRRWEREWARVGPDWVRGTRE